jgi:hypothetical protein
MNVYGELVLAGRGITREGRQKRILRREEDGSVQHRYI